MCVLEVSTCNTFRLKSISNISRCFFRSCRLEHNVSKTNRTTFLFGSYCSIFNSQVPISTNLFLFFLLSSILTCGSLGTVASCIRHCCLSLIRVTIPGSQCSNTSSAWQSKSQRSFAFPFLSITISGVR